MTQYHNIPPVYDKNSRILILGSFPSVKSREAQFFYGHPQNRFWKVMSAVLDCDLPVTVQEKHGEALVTFKKHGMLGNRLRYLICRRCGAVLYQCVAEPYKYPPVK